MAADGLVSVPAGHAAVIYDRTRGVLSNPVGEGLHLKIPFWQVSTIFDTRTQEYTMSISGGSDLPVSARSRDGQVVEIDATVLYHVKPENTPLVMRKLGREREYFIKVVKPISRSVIRDVVAMYYALDLVSEERGAMKNKMIEDLRVTFNNHNIYLEDVVLRDIRFSSEFAAVIEEKKIAEQKILVADNRRLEAEKLKEKRIVEAEGEAEAISLRGTALRKNPQVVQLEMVEKLAPNIKWGVLPDGVLPMLDMKSLN